MEEAFFAILLPRLSTVPLAEAVIAARRRSSTEERW